jgi:hypothetical protein
MAVSLKENIFLLWMKLHAPAAFKSFRTYFVHTFPPGLPDGLFSNKSSKLGKFWREGLAMEDIGILY